MSKSRWLEIQTILLEVLEAPTERRGALLNERWARDPSIHRELEALVRSAEEGERYFSDLAERAGLDSRDAARETLGGLFEP
ncbi:MAG: hypothetical protein MJB57_15140 [Gemmatimonadetes bacterium]|nr:hypothetical protein [Gemmatimonadota bacterium]